MESRHGSVEELKKALCKASEELEKVFGEEFVGLALFGSWARGEAEKDSDVDVLVLLKSMKGLRVRSKIYKAITRIVGRPLTIVDVRVGEVTSEDLEVTPLLLNILYDAIIVFDREGVLKELVEKVNKLITKAKLVRYKTPNGKYGWKRVDGKPIEYVEV